MRYLLLFFLLSILVSVQAQNTAPALLPWPAKAEFTEQKLWVTEQFTINSSWPDSEVIRYAIDDITWLVSKQTGVYFLPSGARKTTVPAQLSISYKTKANVKLGADESYTLDVTSSQITLTAATDLGIRYGLETLLQLLQKDEKGWYFIGAKITDVPRFAWRGLLIDAARHFIPVPVLKRNIDAMATAKLNVLHWHLSDDQAFRVESKALPKLHQAGSDGQYYTQQQVKEIIEYAAAKGIRVVPEFDMPAHATAMIVAYPELASNDSTYGLPERWGILNISIDPTKESTYQLLEKFFAEMTALFPDEYFHIGGDENDGRQWKKNPRIQAFMAKNALKDVHELQLYFNKRIAKLLAANGKKMVGWDEILNPDLPKTAVIQSWRGNKSLTKAAQQGHQVILSNGYYLDLNYPASQHYLQDPIPANTPLTNEQQKLVLGGEAAMWAEFADSVLLDAKIWPRAAAVAERLWSPQNVRDVEDMYRRLEVFSAQLEFRGLTHNSSQEKLLRNMAKNEHYSPLKVLADVIEPVKEYKRHFQGKKYSTKTPLNRLVDAARPESDVARKFTNGVDKFLLKINNKQAAKADFDALITQLRAWQENHEKLKEELIRNPNLTEYYDLSENLASISAVSLEALHFLQTGKTKPAGWAELQQNIITEARKPVGQAELAIVNAIEKLLKAL